MQAISISQTGATKCLHTYTAYKLTVGQRAKQQFYKSERGNMEVKPLHNESCSLPSHITFTAELKAHFF